MKESFYNYYIDLDTKGLVFNGLTKRYFLTSKKNFQQFKSILCNPDAYYEEYKPFMMRMQNEGFITTDDTDEETIFREQYKREMLPNSLHIMILPTYQCNLRCWYCIQEHQDMVMSESTITRIEKHIEKYIGKNNIKDFRLSWFGGEPLLNFETIVKLTTFAKNFCEQKKISFSCSITTNGTLIKKEWLPIFRNLEILNFQITIDGDREQHNKVKRMSGKSAFDISLRNIRMIVEQIPEASVNLRINYTEKSDPIKIKQSIDEVIPPEIRGKITIVPCKVWQIDDGAITNQFKNTLRSREFIGSYKYFNLRLGICYVDKTHYETIFPNGRVGKCDNDNPNKVHGLLKDDGTVVWDKPNIDVQEHLFCEKSICKGCKHLPICYGPCSKRISEMLEKYGKIVCLHNDSYSVITDYIMNYIETYK